MNGQKVWTSMAQHADWGILLARTESRRAEARRHPLLHARHEARRRASTSGRCASSPATRCSTRCSSTTCSCPTTASSVQEHDGWRAAAHDARERAGVHGRRSDARAAGLEQMLKLRPGARPDRRPARRSTRSAASWPRRTRSRASGFRLTLAALAGADPSGSEASVRKLLGVLHDQQVQEVGLRAGRRRRRGRRG